MKLIALTQRVAFNKSLKERNDLIDQKWFSFLRSVNICPLIIPNDVTFAKEIISNSLVQGILFTGGNSLTKYGGDAPERDNTEKFLLEWALKNDLPLLGVCRGMQVIQNYFGVSLNNVEGHVNIRHSMKVKDGFRLSDIVKKYKDINSYHNQGAKTTEHDIIDVARSEDGVIMAIEHSYKNVFGIMWHPERENKINLADIMLFNYIFGNQL